MGSPHPSEAAPAGRCGLELPADAPASELVRVILTTSPSPAQPGTDLLEEVLRSMRAHAPALWRCRLIVVRDGAKAATGDKIQWRMAKVDEAARSNYEEYQARLRAAAAEAAGASAEAWMPPRTELLELPANHGFGFAVRAALGRVDAPLVCVIQHDCTFMRSVDVEPIVRSMLEYGGRVWYVVMHTKSTGKYVACQSSRLREKGVRAEDCDIEKLALPLLGEGGRLLPCLTWYDSTHLFFTSYYRDFVFSPAEGVVKKGGLIEGEMGQLQFPEFCARGPAPALERWRTYLYDDGSDAPMVGHLDGKRFKSVETLKQLYGDRATGRRASDAPDLPATGVGSDSGEGCQYLLCTQALCTPQQKNSKTQLGGIICLKLLVQYNLICCMCTLSCQGSPRFATLLATFEEHVCETKGVRQAVPPDTHTHLTKLKKEKAAVSFVLGSGFGCIPLGSGRNRFGSIRFHSGSFVARSGSLRFRVRFRLVPKLNGSAGSVLCLIFA